MAKIHPIIVFLAARRDWIGMTQREVAKRMGTTQSAISDIETGGNPTIATLDRYADTLGCSLDVHIR